MRKAVGVVGASLVVGLGWVAPARAGDPPSPEPVRILLVGDSVTQGSAGDWTWRYRLWQHFAAAGVAVDFVGPRDDLFDNLTGSPGAQTYADPAFDRDHAARWGAWLSLPDVPVAQLTQTYQPDVIVEMLGVNDLLDPGVEPAAVHAQVVDFVAGARSVDPTVDVVISEATQTWFPKVSTFNAGLDQIAADATNAESSVVVAHVSEGYDAAADTWDNSHPNAQGEVRIAAEVADALHEVGVGPAAVRPLPDVPVGPRLPASLTGSASDRAVTLLWSGPPGATAQDLWLRDTTLGEAWRRAGRFAGPTWTSGPLVNGHRYEFRVQPVKGDDDPEGAVFSDVVALTPYPPLRAPSRLSGDGGRRCAVLDWASAPFADRYLVQRKVAGGWRTVGRPTRSAFVARDLPRRSSWTLGVRTVRDGVVGERATIVVRPGDRRC